MKNNYIKRLTIIIILTLGLVLRILLAFIEHRSDTTGFVIDANLFLSGVRNIYLFYDYYNYSPVFFYILGFIGVFHKIVPFFSLYFLILLFLTVIDVISSVFIYKIAQIIKINEIKSLILFFLNPVSIIITGYHGQFDNFAILLLLISIYIFLKPNILCKYKYISIIFISTTGLILKHIILFPLFTFYLRIFKSLPKATLFILFSISFFLISFMPFISTAKQQIMNNVFNYKSMEGFYGVSYFLMKYYPDSAKSLNSTIIRNIFLLSNIIYVIIISKKDLIRSILVTVLFFLTFTTGIGGQYFLLPIAFASLRPSFMFYIYSFIVTLFYLGNNWEFNIIHFKIISWNTVWIFTFLWFITENYLLIKRNKDRNRH